MLMAHPAVLKNLVEQYETLRALHAEKGSEEARMRMEDVAYTLCVSTGTRDVDAALIAARYRLPGARVEDDSALTETVKVVPAPAGLVATGPDAEVAPAC